MYDASGGVAATRRQATTQRRWTMMGPAFSQLDLEAVQARHNDLTREYQKVQKAKGTNEGSSRLRGAILAVTSRF
jgi:hypothetical protein